jgi:processive 1,2-diacylglycerol beta-glucosyltransferase
MARLYDSESGKLIGTITKPELEFLIEQLEEEEEEDQDYYIDWATLDWFEDNGADASLLKLLRGALGNREGMDIRWTED